MRTILASDSSLAWGFSCGALATLTAHEGAAAVEKKDFVAAAPVRRKPLPVGKTSLGGGGETDTFEALQGPLRTASYLTLIDTEIPHHAPLGGFPAV